MFAVVEKQSSEVLVLHFTEAVAKAAVADWIDYLGDIGFDVIEVPDDGLDSLKWFHYVTPRKRTNATRK
jgi:hypothetical protein